jgi:hypothetical protein
MNEERIRELHKELYNLKKSKEEIENEYELARAELLNLINEQVGNSPEIFIDIPDWVPLMPEAFRNYVSEKKEEATITNIDFEKRLVRVFVPADYRRFTFESEFGKIERRANKGKTYLDLSMLKALDEELWSKVVKYEPVLDEDALEKVLKEDEEAERLIQSSIKAGKPKMTLHIVDPKETSQ